MYCDECGKTGHLKSNCFEIYGYPDWYKTLMEKRKGITNSNQVLSAGENENHIAAAVSVLIKKELQKLMPGDEKQQINTHSMFDNFSGKSSPNISCLKLSKNTWVVDSGASSHMCKDNSLFKLLHDNVKNAYVYLADGTKRCSTAYRY
ncbi:UNVERIFIED_CONTAM: hypothetical protein Sindi_0697500 [Sesamum indicum]